MQIRVLVDVGEPPGSPKPSPLVRCADEALRAFPEAGRFVAAGRRSQVVRYEPEDRMARSLCDPVLLG
jgi:hypothetical protein